MKKRIVSMLLVLAMLLTTALTFTACGEGTTPQLRINSETNIWEVSYDEGASWVSLDVKATGENGKDGKDGVDGTNGKDGIDGINGKDGVDGINGQDGKDGIDGQDGADGADGANGSNGKDGIDGQNGTDGENGLTPTIGANGNWFIGETDTGIYAGTTEKITVTFKSATGNTNVTTTKGSKVSFWLPYSPTADFAGWFEDEACTTAFNFNNAINENTIIYAKWNFHKELLEKDTLRSTIGEMMKTAVFGKANCFGTTACFGSVYFRVLKDDHKYYDGAAGIANYLKGVFVEDEAGNVTVGTSTLSGMSYTSALTIINFASAFSSYEQYITRNNLEMPEEIAAQKKLAIKYFETVDNTAKDYHKASGTGGFSFPSMGIAVVALGSLMGQHKTERFDTLIKDAYDHVDSNFWNSGMYLEPFYQLCAKYDWYDLNANKSALKDLADLTSSQVQQYYAYGIDVAAEVPELWEAYVINALIDGKLSTAEAKAFGYHYAYQDTNGKCWLGVYGSSANIVDFAE